MDQSPLSARAAPVAGLPDAGAAPDTHPLYLQSRNMILTGQLVASPLRSQQTGLVTGHTLSYLPPTQSETAIRRTWLPGSGMEGGCSVAGSGDMVLLFRPL